MAKLVFSCWSQLWNHHPPSLCLLQIINNRAMILIFPLRKFVFYAYLSPHFLSNHTPSSANCYVLFIPWTCWHECKRNTISPIVCCLLDSVANEAAVVDTKGRGWVRKSSHMTRREWLTWDWMAVLLQHCHSNGHQPPQMRPEQTFPGDWMMQGVVLDKWVAGPNVWWQVATKVRANQCEGAAYFAQLKSYKIEGWKGNVVLATDVKFDPCKATFVGMECWEGIGETGWVLVEWKWSLNQSLWGLRFSYILTGLLNSRLRVIIMENPKDTLNLYSKPCPNNIRT
jgi:hypothetical protein